jgi:hypothetical protein
MARNPLYTSNLPTGQHLFVRVEKAIRAGSGKGVNFPGAVVKDTHGEIVGQGDLFLFDSVMQGASGMMQPITEVFQLSTRDADNGKTYWNMHPVEKLSDGTIPKVLDVAPAPEKKAGGYGGGKRYDKVISRAQWEEMIKESARLAVEVAADAAVPVEVMFHGFAAKIAGDAMFVDPKEWESEGPAPVTDEDIPF